MSATPLNLLLGQLVEESGARAAFQADAEGFLAGHGHAGLDPRDLQEALGVLAEGTPTIDAGAVVEVTTLVDSTWFSPADPVGDETAFGSGDRSDDSVELLAGDDLVDEFDTELAAAVEPDPEWDLEIEPDAVDEFGFGHGDPHMVEDEPLDDLDAVDPLDS